VIAYADVCPCLILHTSIISASLFGAQKPTTTSLFGSTQPTQTGLFGSSATSTANKPLFGSTGTTGFGGFGSTATATQPTAAAGTSIFGSTVNKVAFTYYLIFLY
jgi:hypothetical protein